MPEIKHGTPHAYQHYKCRCADCCAGHSRRCAALRERRKKRTPPERVHGTYGGYCNWSCRCDRCKAAASAVHKSYYKRCKEE